MFEELDDLHGSEVRSVNESTIGFQSAVSPNVLYGKHVTSGAWIARNEDAAYIFDLMYSPDGDLYTKNNNTLLYSQDNGETFSSIDYPNSIFAFEYAKVYVLHDDILFISDNTTGDCYYSLNNGQSWVWVGQLLLSTDPVVKLVDTFIYVADPSWFGARIIARINKNTGHLEIANMASLASNYIIVYYQIMEDGTVYMYGRNNVGPQIGDHLLQYKFGQDVESLGLFPNLKMYSHFMPLGQYYTLSDHLQRTFLMVLNFNPWSLPDSQMKVTGGSYFLKMIMSTS